MQISDIVPKYAERAVFVGKSGSGKSFLAKTLLQHCEYNDIVIVDPKGEIFAKNCIYLHDPYQFPKGDWHGLIIYQPDIKFDNEEGYEYIFKCVYYRRHTLVYIDELYSVCKPTSNPMFLRALYTRGRGLGISVWGCTQRPTWVPLFCISEVNSVYEFMLKFSDDRKRMSGIIGNEGMQLVPEREFLYAYDLQLVKRLTYNEQTNSIDELRNEVMINGK